MTSDIEFAARNIVNQLGDLYYERIPSKHWVRVRQQTNDMAERFVVKIISKLRPMEYWPFSRRMVEARAAWKQYRVLIGSPEEEIPPLYDAGFTMGVAAAQRGGGEWTNLDTALLIAPRIQLLLLIQEQLKKTIMTSLDGSKEAALNHPLNLEIEAELKSLRTELEILI
jgi:hypothetical protein